QPDHHYTPLPATTPDPHTAISVTFILSQSSTAHPDLPSFPTRRSSDLGDHRAGVVERQGAGELVAGLEACHGTREPGDQQHDKQDRKSTRLNSSHVSISYAVFCWKKKNHVRRWL